MPFWKCFSCLKFPNEENITKLDYSNGTLTDVPPDVSQFERTLEELYLSSNRITDLPPELFYCQGIRVLKLNDNELETIPNAIGSLRQLQVLDLSRNALTYIPDNIKSCKHLTHLDLSLNNLQRLPDAITSLISLQELLLNETYLEFLPANFGRLVNLKILELRSNNLITLPKSMARLTDLVRIDIGANEFTELPEVIGQLTQLRELWIDYNRIRRISANISNLRELIHFEANSNQLTSLPNEISHWRNLEVLSLSTNDLENLPFSIGMLKRLVTIKCDSNQLREMPDSICHLENLEEMVVNHNYIMRLPSTIGLLRKLRFLAADENLLRRLPDEICSCANLSVLSVRGNKLIELPHDIGHLTNLHVLNVVNNCISHLPVSVLNLTNLTALWISDNQSQPLVPLQYFDSNTKSQLTCFMLPQAGSNDQTRPPYEQQKLDYRSSALSPEFSDSGSTNSWMHLHQQQLNKHHNIPGIIQQQPHAQNVQVNSPSRRICFADETGARTNEPITTRLMRSPTPYPKELRLMAKYVKNMNNQSNNYRGENIEMVSPPKTDEVDVGKFNNESQASLRIKEARVLSNPGGITHNLNDSYDDSALPTSNNATNCDMPSAQINCFYNTLTNADSNPSNYINLHQSSILSSSTSYDTYDGLIPPLSKPIQTQDVHHHQSYTDYNHMPIFNNTIHKQESLNWREPIYEARLPNPIQQQKLHHPASFQILQKPEYVQRQPPPYHIAKVFTKKSPEDLLSYDSLRNQVEHRNGSIQDNEYDGERGSILRDEIDDNFNSTFTEQNDRCSEISCSTNNNNNNHNNSNNNLSEGRISSLGGMINSENLSRPPSITLSKNGSNAVGRNSPEMILNGFGEEQYQQHLQQQQQIISCAKTPSKPALSSSSSQWLFGLHKNPTVKQIIIKKDPILGFEIKEIPNQGIFVSITIPNTPASGLLRVDDKILDVDGFDFTKASLEEARQVLMDTGPTFSIMISRK